jgi:mycothiol synthase
MEPLGRIMFRMVFSRSDAMETIIVEGHIRGMVRALAEEHPETKRARKDIPGIAYRNYRGVEDIPGIVMRENACWKADLVDLVMTEDELKQELASPVNMDPNKDIIFAEVDGEYAGHAMLNWQLKIDGSRHYFIYAFVASEWRGKGLREILVHRGEERLREIASTHPKDERKYFETYANAEKNDWKSAIESVGYTPAWHLFEMVRPNLDNIPDKPLPSGIEVRALMPEHYRVIWDAMKEAFRDERSFSEDKYNDTAFNRMINHRLFAPQHWQVAWDGAELVGGVKAYINPEENSAFNRRWGHTEEVFVRKPWRHRGIAGALIARGLRVLKEQGMEQATLDVDTENPSGALKLYTSLGFKPVLQFSFYSKDLG